LFGSKELFFPMNRYIWKLWILKRSLDNMIDRASNSPFLINKFNTMDIKQNEGVVAKRFSLHLYLIAFKTLLQLTLNIELSHLPSG